MDDFVKSLHEKIKKLENRYDFLIKCLQVGFFFTNLVFVVMLLIVIKYTRVAQW